MTTTHDRTHLEYLLLETMRRVVPDVASECRQQWKKAGQPGEPDRTALVHCLLDHFGPQRFLELCEELPSHVPESPLIFFLFNSPTPAQLIRKISIYAPHFHSTRRLELVEEGDNYCIVEDIANSPKSISVAEDMFVSSTLKGVLREFGCNNIQVTWEAVSSSNLYDILTGINIRPLSIENVTRWKYNWEVFTHPGTIKGMDDFFLKNTGVSPNVTSISLSSRIKELLLENLPKHPTTEQIAAKLGLSPRTLQRKLETEGTTYSKIYTELRLKAAENLLHRTTLTIAEISTLTGFNDSAHLCREFKKKFNMTPKDYRKS